MFYCTFRDYAKKWDEIAAIFSKDAVLKGSFDKYASSAKGKRGTTEVDSAFLAEIEGWHDLLARNIALRNSSLTQRELNFAVQQSIDRIIFLRICEDRAIEPFGKLGALQNGANVYDRLRELFRAADERYNSGLFHFTQEKHGAGTPDELTLHLSIDDKPLKEIFKNRYYPDCPYELSVLSADTLGSVCEQFLGKVICLTAGSRAVVEDKPEVKKAGGIFYSTPLPTSCSTPSTNCWKARAVSRRQASPSSTRRGGVGIVPDWRVPIPARLVSGALCGGRCGEEQ